MSMRVLLRFLVSFLIIGAVIQIYGVGNRAISAFWQWYKFNNYSNDGYITISYLMFGATACLSMALIILGVFVIKRSEEMFVRKLAAISTSSLTIGLSSLLILVISPLAVLVSR